MAQHDENSSPNSPSTNSRARMDVLRERLAERLDALHSGRGSSAPLSPDALEELAVVLEELDVAEEEIRSQNDELQAMNRFLEQEHQRYLELFEFAPIGYLVTDLHGVIQDFNHGAADLLGVAPQALTDEPLAACFVRERRSVVRQKINTIVPGTVESWETRLRSGRGRETDVAVILTRAEHCMKQGTSTEQGCLRWLLHDITVRKQVETAEREQFFRATFEQAALGMAHLDAAGHFLRHNQKLPEMLGYAPEALRHLSLLDLSHAEDRLELDRALRALFRRRSRSSTAELRLKRQDGSLIWINLTLSMIHVSDEQAPYAVAVAEDITPRKAVEDAEREQRLLAEALRDTAVLLNSTLDLSEVLDRILASVGRVAPHDAADIMFIENGVARVARGQGYAQYGLEEALRDFSLPLADAPALRQMIETRQPFMIADTHDYPGWKPLPGEEWLRAWASVPIELRGEIIGFLNLVSATPGFFTPGHTQRLTAFAAQAATAIHNAQTYQQAQQLAALEERQRLARELHDAVTQTLFTASLTADMLPRIWERAPQKALEQVRQLQVLTRSAMAEMRILLLELRPEHLLKLNLAEMLRQLAQALQGKKHVKVNLLIEDTAPIPPAVQIALYRIAQEAMNNIIKHSKATTLDIHYSSTEQQVELHLMDNGRGFDVDVVMQGMGIQNMRERAGKIDAVLEIESVKRQGTRVSVIWARDKEGDLVQ